MATIGEGLLSAGKSIGEGIEKGRKYQRNIKMIDALKTSLGDKIKPEEQPKLAAMFDDLDPTEDIMPQITAKATLLKAMEGLKPDAKLTKWQKDEQTGQWAELDNPIEVSKDAPNPEWKPEDAEKNILEKQRIEKQDKQIKQIEVSNAAVLGSQLQQNPIYKMYQTMAPWAEQADALIQGVKAGKYKDRFATSDALIKIYSKMFDPTTGVKVEEARMVPEAMSLMNKITAYASKVQKGGELTDENMQDLQTAMDAAVEVMGTTMNKELDLVESTARARGITDMAMVHGGRRYVAPASVVIGGKKYREGDPIVIKGKTVTIIKGPDGTLGYDDGE